MAPCRPLSAVSASVSEVTAAVAEAAALAASAALAEEEEEEVVVVGWPGVAAEAVEGEGGALLAEAALAELRRRRAPRREVRGERRV